MGIYFVYVYWCACVSHQACGGKDVEVETVFTGGWGVLIAWLQTAGSVETHG